MNNYLLIIMYDGQNYHGFQVQKNAHTVCEALQDGMEKILGERPDVKGCSRTDAGVHANMFGVSFKTEKELDPAGFAHSLNAVLPEDIAVKECENVPIDFHARYEAKGKRYIYKIWNAPYMNPFLVGKALHYPAPLDENLLDAVACDFVGEKDFSAFAGAENTKEDCVREIYDCSVERDGDLVTVSVSGNGFLYNMVRIIVGTLLEVNEGKISPMDIEEIIESRDRTKSGRTAKPQGLYLDEVFYDL